MEHFDWITGAVIPYINFFLFFAVLIFFAKKPMKQLAEDRYRKYVTLHTEAKTAFSAAEKQNLELKSKLQNLESEIDGLRKIALENAKHEYDVLIKQAHQLSEHIIDEARMITEAEVESAKEVIKKEIVDQLTLQVKNKIKNEFNPTEHQDLIKKQFSKVEAVRLEDARI